MFERYTDNAMNAIGLAQEEACMTGRGWVDPGEILIGLISCGGDSGELLDANNVTIENARIEIERVNGPKTNRRQRNLPFPERSQDVLKRAQQLADKLGHSHITSAHLLFGLIQQRISIGATLLQTLGVSLESLDQQLQARLKEETTDSCTDKRHAHVS